MPLGGLAAAAVSLPIGLICFRLRGPYFSLATLAVAELVRLTALNWEQVTNGPVGFLITKLPGVNLLGWAVDWESKDPFYVCAALLAALALAATRALKDSRLGAFLVAIREDEDAAEAAGVGALRLKLTALALSTGLAGLAGGLFAYYHISYYPSHPFSPTWTFDALLMTFIGGVGTLHGPVLGAVLYVVLKEYLALRWVDFHLLIFGALFIAIVLLLPGGLVQAVARARRLLAR